MTRMPAGVHVVTGQREMQPESALPRCDLPQRGEAE